MWTVVHWAALVWAVGSAIYVVLMVRDLVGIVGAHRFPRWATDAVRSTEGLRSWLVGRASEDDEPEEPDELGEPDEPDGPHAAGRDPERP